MGRAPAPALAATCTRACHACWPCANPRAPPCPLQHTTQLSPADIARLVSGYAALQHSPGIVLFDSLAAAAKERQAEFTAEERAAVAAAYEALGYRGKSPF